MLDHLDQLANPFESFDATLDNPMLWSEDRIREAFDVDGYSVARLIEVTGRSRASIRKILLEG